MKKIAAVFSPPQGHWVGDGFPVRSLFSYHKMGAEQISPFLLLDYAGPYQFTPSPRPRGVGAHPHRGFETVTIVYEGEVSHRDSTGKGGTIGPGDVQWMTAGNGIVHEEFHSQAFSDTGGAFEMVQLWVNLRAKDKGIAPSYQAITANMIPKVTLPNAAGTASIIAGDFAGTLGPAHTHSPMNVWDIRLTEGKEHLVTVPAEHSCMVVVLSGELMINQEEVIKNAELVMFESTGTTIQLEAKANTKLLVLTGEPFNEPVVGHGPFVMNTAEEIRDSLQAFHLGKFGKM